MSHMAGEGVEHDVVRFVPGALALKGLDAEGNLVADLGDHRRTSG